MTSIKDKVEALFQVLPAASLKEIQKKLKAQGIPLSIGSVRNLLRELRKKAVFFGWTVPHVDNTAPFYYPMLCDKDGTFHTDPIYKAGLLDGSKCISKRMIAESWNHCQMLRATSQAKHISRALREEFADLSDEYEYVSKKVKRAFRKLEAMD